LKRRNLTTQSPSNPGWSIEPGEAGADGPWRVHWALARQPEPRLATVVRQIARAENETGDEFDMSRLLADNSHPVWRMLDDVPPCLLVGEIATPPVPRPVTVPMPWPALEAECAAVVEDLLWLLRFFDDNRTTIDSVAHDAVTLPEAIAVLRRHAGDAGLWTDTSPSAGAHTDLWLTAGSHAAIPLNDDAHAVASLWRDEMQAGLPRFAQERHNR